MAASPHSSGLSPLHTSSVTGGLPECNSNDLPEEDYGLVSYRNVGDCELFLYLPNGTRYSIEQVQLQRNARRTVKVDPPPPTAEEVAYKLE